jgi:hypothetical protein
MLRRVVETKSRQGCRRYQSCADDGCGLLELGEFAAVAACCFEEGEEVGRAEEAAEGRANV